MAKKVKLSQIYNPTTTVENLTSQVTHQPLQVVTTPKDESFEVVPADIPKIGKIKKDSKKKRNITKPLGRPVVFQGEETRVNFNTMIRKSYVAKIKKLAFKKDVSNADIIDEILSSYFDTGLLIDLLDD